MSNGYCQEQFKSNVDFVQKFCNVFAIQNLVFSNGISRTIISFFVTTFEKVWCQTKKLVKQGKPQYAIPFIDSGNNQMLVCFVTRWPPPGNLGLG